MAIAWVQLVKRHSRSQLLGVRPMLYPHGCDWEICRACNACLLPQLISATAARDKPPEWASQGHLSAFIRYTPSGIFRSQQSKLNPLNLADCDGRRPVSMNSCRGTSRHRNSTDRQSGNLTAAEGFPLGYEVLPGHTSDKTTLRASCARSSSNTARPRGCG